MAAPSPGSSPADPKTWLALLSEMDAITSGQVKPQDISEELVRRANQYFKEKQPYHYKRINLRQLLSDNKVIFGDEMYQKVANALEKIYHYAAGLLAPSRSRLWKAIKFSSPFYHHNISFVKGGKELLKTLGYSLERDRTLEFEQEEPDKGFVTEVAAELLTAKLEVEWIEQHGGFVEEEKKELEEKEYDDNDYMYESIPPGLQKPVPSYDNTRPVGKYPEVSNQSYYQQLHHQQHDQGSHHQPHDQGSYHQPHDQGSHHQPHDPDTYHQPRDQGSHHQPHDQGNYHQPHDQGNYHQPSSEQGTYDTSIEEPSFATYQYQTNVPLQKPQETGPTPAIRSESQGLPVSPQHPPVAAPRKKLAASTQVISKTQSPLPTSPAMSLSSPGDSPSRVPYTREGQPATTPVVPPRAYPRTTVGHPRAAPRSSNEPPPTTPPSGHTAISKPHPPPEESSEVAQPVTGDSGMSSCDTEDLSKGDDEDNGFLKEMERKRIAALESLAREDSVERLLEEPTTLQDVPPAPLPEEPPTQPEPQPVRSPSPELPTSPSPGEEEEDEEAFGTPPSTLRVEHVPEIEDRTGPDGQTMPFPQHPSTSHRTGPSPQAQDSPAVTHRSPLNKEKGLREFFVAPLDVEDMKRQKEEARQKALKEGKIAPDTDERDKQRVAELRDDGDFFIYWLMQLTQYGFEPEEVDIAVNAYRHTECRNPHEYLSNVWEHNKKTLMARAEWYAQHEGYDHIGRPSRVEARDCLLECNGNVREAITYCIGQRNKKITEFLEKCPMVDRQTAAKVLTDYQLNVDIAVKVVEMESLDGIRQFIWQEHANADPEELLIKEEKRMEGIVDNHQTNDKEFCCRLLMVEFNLPSWDNAELVFQLRGKGHDFHKALATARNCNTLEEADKYFNQECTICYEKIFIDDMVTMLHCACSVCKDCFKEHYSMVAREQTLGHFNCLVCSQPDLSATDIDKDDYLTLFSNLLNVHLSNDDYQLFQKKATDYVLLKDPNFRWCPSCGQGFIHEPPAAGNLRIACPHCDKNSCFNCKKVWEEQHQGITCVDFAKWKAENDEENQQKGLAAFLKENGIECPKCHYRYDLAKGGCLHFTCAQCPIKTEFCGGCGSIFDKNCHKFKACTTKGFHTHHPRDCLFYIRDWEVERLQKALEDSKIEFDTDPPEKQVNAAEEGGIEEAGLLRCRVILQKEVGNDKVDEECGDGCEAGHAGLCKKHYKEYLICKLNEASVDPADFMDLDELRAVLGREEKELPPKNNPNEGDDDYLKRMKEYVKKELPLEKRGALKF